jgi:Protein of unknown function (DUF4236)
VGFKFRKRIKLAPGLWVNLSNGFPSFSIGKRGLTTNIGKRGVRTTLGIPGSGGSYTTKTAKWPESNSSLHVPPADNPFHPDTNPGEKTLKKIWPLVLAPLCGGVVLLFAVVHGNHPRSHSVAPTATPELAASVSAATPEVIQSRATPTPELTPEVKRAELVRTPDVRRAELVPTPEVRRAQLVATPAHERTHAQAHHTDSRQGHQ